MHGYIFSAFLLFICGIFFFITNLVSGSSAFEGALETTSFIFLLIVPIVTMKSIAEEKGQRTDQLLYSLPVSTTEIVMGKFLALYTVFSVPVAIMSIYPLILSLYGKVSLGSTYSCLLGFFLLGGTLLSIGLFISSLTESQVLAAVISFGAMLTIYLASIFVVLSDYLTVLSSVGVNIGVFVVLGLLFGLCVFVLSKDWWISGSFALAAEIIIVTVCIYDRNIFEGLFAKVIEKLSVYEMYYNMSMGIFDLTAVVYFISIMAVCLFLTVQSLERKRYN